MSADLALATALPAHSISPMEAAKLQLIKDFSALRMPAYPNFPSPIDHEAFGNVIRDAALIFDEWLSAVGHEVRDNSTVGIHFGLFAGSFTGAIDGNETGAVEEAAEALREDRRSMRRAM